MSQIAPNALLKYAQLQMAAESVFSFRLGKLEYLGNSLGSGLALRHFFTKSTRPLRYQVNSTLRSIHKGWNSIWH
jgi:hypothetical protein